MKFLNILMLGMIGSIAFIGCQKEYPNPNAATEESVLNNVDGLLGLCNGVKREYAVGGTSVLYNAISANGLTTKELYVINTGNGELAALEAGGSTVGATNAFVRNIWSTSNLVKSHAQLLIDNADNVSDPGTSAGIRAYGHLFKALALGTMSQFFEQVTAEVLSTEDIANGLNAGFVSRTQALQEAVTLLKQASDLLAQTPVSSYFIQKTGSDIDLVNSLHALRARYANMLGNHAESIEAASKVNQNAKSVINFDAINQNPVFRSSLVNNNTYNGLVNFGLFGSLTPEAGDLRISFYLGENMTPVSVKGFYKSDTDAIPLYYPGEINLILAEAYARQGAGSLSNAISELNKVRTKSADALGLTAGLSVYSGSETQADILNEIYKQRCIELYMSGMKLEDSRRFSRPGPLSLDAERSRNYYPYPLVERDNNPNTPEDPEI